MNGNYYRINDLLEYAFEYCTSVKHNVNIIERFILEPLSLNCKQKNNIKNIFGNIKPNNYVYKTKRVFSLDISYDCYRLYIFYDIVFKIYLKFYYTFYCL